MIYKRSHIYWTKFQHAGRMVYKSTGQTSQTKARQIEAKLRSELAMGNFGILTRKAVPTLAEFCEKRFAPWARSTCSLKTWRDFYRVGLLAIEGYAPLARLPLDAITTERIAEFASHRQAQGMKVTTVNASLRILRRVLRIAMEWGEIGRVPKVKMLPGEQHREFVLSPEEEARYLIAAPEPLAAVATVLADTGMRPEECYRMRWEFVAWVNGRHGTLFVSHGKTKAARRILPMTARVRSILEARWNAARKPLEGFVWTAPTKSGHLEPSSLKKQHTKALRLSKVRPFVLYSLRHTFLTRLGESGCDVWTLARIAGHTSIAISARYVHPSSDAVLRAMERHASLNQGGDKTGDSQQMITPTSPVHLALRAENTTN